MKKLSAASRSWMPIHAAPLHQWHSLIELGARNRDAHPITLQLYSPIKRAQKLN